MSGAVTLTGGADRCGRGGQSLTFGWHFATWHAGQEVALAQSVKLADDIMALIRREAELHSRSVAGQITHWVKIGRAIEHSGRFDHARITAALAGQLDTTQLQDGEDAAWLDAFTEKMGQPSESEEAFFAKRQALGRGVGLDAGGNLVYAGTSDTAA